MVQLKCPAKGLRFPLCTGLSSEYHTHLCFCGRGRCTGSLCWPLISSRLWKTTKSARENKDWSSTKIQLGMPNLSLHTLPSKAVLWSKGQYHINMVVMLVMSTGLGSGIWALKATNEGHCNPWISRLPIRVRQTRTTAGIVHRWAQSSTIFYLFASFPWEQINTKGRNHKGI